MYAGRFWRFLGRLLASVSVHPGKQFLRYVELFQPLIDLADLVRGTKECGLISNTLKNFPRVAIC